MATSLFAQLLPFEWQSGGGSPPVQFPVVSMRVSLSHDIAEHKFWGKDSAKLEATGRNPLVFSAHIPFRNGIVPGKNEKWSTLYPTAYRDFLKATADRATGKLIHPELGACFCKVRSIDTTWDANRRDGCDVEATWEETLPDERDAVGLETSSPVTQAQLGALDLDAQITSVNPPLPKLPKYEPDLAAAMRGIAAIGDQASLLAMRGAGVVDGVAYRLNAIEDSFSKAAAAPSRAAKRVKDIIHPDTTARARNAMGYPARRSVARMRNALQDIRQKLLETGKPIVLYRVAKATTLAGIVSATHAPISDLMALNPTLLKSPVVPIGTIVRYYSSADR